jgi:hypothetical protein
VNKNLGISEEITGLLEERDSYLEELDRIEKQLTKKNFDPEKMIGACYRAEGYPPGSMEYIRIAEYERGAFNYVRITICPKAPKADREDQASKLVLGRQTPGTFFQSDMEQIPPSEFDDALNRLMGMVPR